MLCTPVTSNDESSPATQFTLVQERQESGRGGARKNCQILRPGERGRKLSMAYATHSPPGGKHEETAAVAKQRHGSSQANRAVMRAITESAQSASVVCAGRHIGTSKYGRQHSGYSRAL